VEKAGLLGLIFYDTGNSWLKDNGYDFGNLRKSAGVGIRWLSPMGPLRLEYGWVLDPQPGETTSNWEFTIGSLF
jgi:outer membrane protein insertion porin family